MNHEHMIWVYDYDFTIDGDNNDDNYGLKFPFNLSLNEDNIPANLLGYIIRIDAEYEDEYSDPRTLYYNLSYSEVMLENGNISNSIDHPMGDINSHCQLLGDYGKPYWLKEVDGPRAQDKRFALQPNTRIIEEDGSEKLKTIDFCFISASDFIYIMQSIKNNKFGSLIISGSKLHVGDSINSSISNSGQYLDSNSFFTLKFETSIYTFEQLNTLSNSISTDDEENNGSIVEPDMLFADPCPPLWSLSQNASGMRLTMEQKRKFNDLAKLFNKVEWITTGNINQENWGS